MSTPQTEANKDGQSTGLALATCSERLAMAEHCLAEIRAVIPEEWRDVELTACVLRLKQLAEIAEREKRRAYDAWDMARARKPEITPQHLDAIGNAIRAWLAKGDDYRSAEAVVESALSSPNS